MKLIKALAMMDTLTAGFPDIRIREINDDSIHLHCFVDELPEALRAMIMNFGLNLMYADSRHFVGYLMDFDNVKTEIHFNERKRGFGD